jgi:uncharacterized protein (DUF2252 family)
VLEAQAATRVPELAPIRYQRMLVSPLTFYRGAAAVMAADLAHAPSSGLMCQLCGDAHLSNFGTFASPERRLVFDINDFDETHPGPWEWDVKRLAASMVVAARNNGFRRKVRAPVVVATVGRYREAMNRFAERPELDVWYAHADLDGVNVLVKNLVSKARRKQFADAQAKARTRDSAQALRKMTTMVDGRRRIVADPPLIVPVDDLLPDAGRAELEADIRSLLAGYADTLAADRRHLFGAFRFVDMARRVVGVGSVGTRCWMVLLSGRDENDPLLLQVKEAQPSVLAPYVPLSSQPGWASEGERVVSGQRLMQAVSDIVLGWQTVAGIDGKTRDFYVRQLCDWKGSAIVEAMDPEAMQAYGALCGWTLARAQAERRPHRDLRLPGPRRRVRPGARRVRRAVRGPQRARLSTPDRGGAVRPDLRARRDPRRTVELRRRAAPATRCGLRSDRRLRIGPAQAGVEQPQAVQTLQPPHRERVGPRQLRESDPETPQRGTLPDELVDVHDVLGVPTGRQKHQAGRSQWRQVGALPVARVLTQAGESRAEQRDPLGVRDGDLVPQRDVVQADVAQLVTEDEAQSVAVVVIQVREEFVGQHDVVVAGGLRREGVQRAVAVAEEDLRTAAQPQPVRELVRRPVEVGVLPRRQLDGGAAHRRTLRLAYHDQRRDEQKESDERRAQGRRPAGVVETLGQVRQRDGGPHDESDDQHVQHNHEDEEGQLGGVSQPIARSGALSR